MYLKEGIISNISLTVIGIAADLLSINTGALLLLIGYNINSVSLLVFVYSFGLLCSAIYSTVFSNRSKFLQFSCFYVLMGIILIQGVYFSTKYLFFIRFLQGFCIGCILYEIQDVSFEINTWVDIKYKNFLHIFFLFSTIISPIIARFLLFYVNSGRYVFFLILFFFIFSHYLFFIVMYISFSKIT
jgi:hypothetical protein